MVSYTWYSVLCSTSHAWYDATRTPPFLFGALFSAGEGSTLVGVVERTDIGQQTGMLLLLAGCCCCLLAAAVTLDNGHVRQEYTYLLLYRLAMWCTRVM